MTSGRLEPVESGFVTIREFDAVIKHRDEVEARVWEAIASQAEAGKEAAARLNEITKSMAVREELDKQRAERDKTRDKRLFAVFLTVVGVLMTASIPFIVKGLSVLFGVIGA